MSTAVGNNNQYVGGSEETTSNTKVNTSYAQNNIDTITEGIDSIAMLDDKSTCASCGKEGNSNDMNTCNKCKEVKYCNAACKKKHRTKHKKACDRRVAELHDEQLFKEIEPEECPICMLPLPYADQVTIGSCCGKRICNGCRFAMEMTSEVKDLCAFCRTPPPISDEDITKRLKALMNKGNGDGFYQLAGFYARGMCVMPQDWNKANELNLKAGELGCADGYFNLGNSYSNASGVERDMKKAIYYWELAAMGGSVYARNNLGLEELKKGNIHRAMKHYMMAARAGYKKSLDIVKECFIQGYVTKEEYADTLRAYQKRQNEMKSDERDKAKAAYRRFEVLTRF